MKELDLQTLLNSDSDQGNPRKVKIKAVNEGLPTSNLDEARVKQLHDELEVLRDGRLESIIPLGDKFWEKRDELMQYLHSGKGD